MEGTNYELKYCERCGTLGLRRARSAESYCRPCGQVLVNNSFPVAARQLLHRKAAMSSPAPWRPKDTTKALDGRVQ
jgi:hypothetical protein